MSIIYGPRKPRTLECVGGWLPALLAKHYMPPLTEKTLRNWRCAGQGPPTRMVRLRVEYSIIGLEGWIAANVEGSGRRAEYFPVDRVPPEDVAQFLAASTSPRFQGKSREEIVKIMERMRAYGSGPAWLKLAGARRVTYHIGDVLDYCAKQGIKSTYTMRPAVAAVVVKPERPLADEMVRLGYPRGHVEMATLAQAMIRARRTRGT